MPLTEPGSYENRTKVNLALKRRKQILHFDEINHSHAVMGFTGRTDLPDFHLFTLEETYPSTRQVMPPYTMRFYCVTLLGQAHDAVLEIDAERLHSPSNTLSFQATGHVRAWVRGEAQRGFIVYFQPEFLSHYPVGLLDEFPFFLLTEPNVFPLVLSQQASLQAQLSQMYEAYKRPHPYRVQILQALLLALLFDCKSVYEDYCANQARKPLKSALATQFQQLLEQHYLTHQSVQAYANLLNVTPNHLSQAISTTLGRTAHELIAERLLLDAKKLLHYTDLPIAEVADYLGFAEPTHFARFFKRKLALTPFEYRHTLSNDALFPKA